MNPSDADPDAELVFGSRTSKLALWQTRTVQQAICETEPSLSCKLETFVTAGDKNLSQPLSQIGGKGLFTEELNQAIRNRTIHLAVHSLKDLPTIEEPEIRILPVLHREDPRDVLIARDQLTLDQLPARAIVGTSSPRRKSQLLAIRPDLDVRSIRGNVPTRIEKTLGSSTESQYDAVILAAAGVLRLGLEQHISQFLSLEQFLPAPGQGCVAATCRTDDEATLSRLDGISDPETRRNVTAERLLLHYLGGGCSAPIAALGRTVQGQLELTGRVGSLDGTDVITQTMTGSDPDQVARSLADQLLNSGGAKILQDVFPLKGQRIVITRAPEQIRVLRDLVETRGATALDLPVIHFQSCTLPNETELRIEQATNANRIVFTSSNAVRFFNQSMPAELVVDWIDKMRFIGPQTAKAMSDAHPDATFPTPSESSSSSYTSASFAQSLDVASGERVLLPVARVHSPDLVDTLSTQGVQVTTWPLYETRQREISTESRDQLEQGFDAILFASPSAIASFCDQVPDFARILSDVIVGCIGSTTRDFALQKGIQVQVTPAQFTVEKLVEALSEFVQNQRKGTE